MSKRSRNPEDLLRGIVEPEAVNSSAAKTLRGRRKSENIWWKALGRNKKVYVLPLVSIAATVGLFAVVATTDSAKSREDTIRDEISARYNNENLTDEQKSKLAILRARELDLDKPAAAPSNLMSK
ncbi:uncharacterized protein V2V93DRAFT_378987 [Kockiozyma suomiensis]|uniref:uncharacterized protein n=1 Tax=Kockiozyma suomiensis TaxID=1337062 RepID=UPI003343D792